MSILEFSLNLPAPTEELIKISEDFEGLPSFLPDQLKSVKIIEKNQEGVTTEEIIVFRTILRKEITQKTLHKKIGEKSLRTEILSGPAKKSIINVLFEQVENGTKITINIDLKLEMKARILEPLIKKWYKLILTSVLYKMNTKIMQSS